MSATLHPPQWKPAATAGNRMVSPQRSLPVLADAPPPSAFRLLPAGVLAGASFTNVLEHLALHSGMDRCRLAESVHISKGYLTKVLGGVGECWARLLVRLMRGCGCLGPLQWLAMEMGCEVVPVDAQALRIAQLQAELADLQAGRAA